MRRCLCSLLCKEPTSKGEKQKDKNCRDFMKIFGTFSLEKGLECFQIISTFWKVERSFSDEKETELGEKFQQHFRTMCIHPYYFEKDDLLHWLG